MNKESQYRFLHPKRGSRYQQLFFGRIRAEVLYRETVGLEPLSVEQVALEYNVPVEAVLEAVEYCLKNQDLLDVERAREAACIHSDHRDSQSLQPANT
ncbi:MAG: hypothetical protein K8T89_11905 [Planctomycetes bacterium]|nr:hypothetical protein [Planctomycetota bacterium]